MKICIFILLIFLFGCNNNQPINKTTSDSIISTSIVPSTQQPPAFEPIYWKDSSNIKLNIISDLIYSKNSLVFDSVLAISYTGFEDGKVFFPVEKNQWVSSIKKIKKISFELVDSFSTILGNKSSFNNPMLISCYEPRFALLYYVGSEIIAETMICLDCARLSSTIKLGNNSYDSSFNNLTLSRLAKLIHKTFSS